MAAPLPPVDPNVKVPGKVAAASAAADAIHAQAYPQPASPQPDQTPSPAPAPAPAPSPAPQPVAPPPAQHAEPQPQPAPQPAPTVPQFPQSRAPAADAITPEEWRQRYLAMEGRYRQQSVSVGALQEQLSEMGDELMRQQEAQQRPRGPQPAQPSPGSLAGVSPEEVETYSPALIDLMTRVARAAVGPDLQNVHSGVNRISQRVQRTTQDGVYAALDVHVPNWREIDLDPRFKSWCNLPDIYSGQIRGALLKGAVSSGQAARAIAFFKGFLAEEQATGNLPDPSAPEPAIAPPRVPAIPLEMLTAPGRAKPAGGEVSEPADMPIYTRAQVKAFYEAVRRGAYLGREQEKNALEVAIFAAQNSGRVR